MRLKLNVLLAKTDHLAASYKKGLEDFIKFFRTSQGAFKGEKKTYEPKPETIDYPSERGNKLVVTTVDEKLEWMEDASEAYIDALFSQEKTNSSGIAKADLIVEGDNFGTYSTLELLRLKSLLESGLLVGMYEYIPVRNDDEEWKQTDAEMYNGRSIMQSPLVRGVKRTTVKQQFILDDPNIEKVPGMKHTPQVGSRDIPVELGDYTHQRFSGEWSHRRRAELLRRRTILLTAVIEALKVANDVESIESNMTSGLIFGYLHHNIIPDQTTSDTNIEDLPR